MKRFCLTFLLIMLIGAISTMGMPSDLHAQIGTCFRCFWETGMECPECTGEYYGKTDCMQPYCGYCESYGASCTVEQEDALLLDGTVIATTPVEDRSPLHANGPDGVSFAALAPDGATEVTNGVDLRRSCDGAVLRWSFDERARERLRARTAKMVL